MKRRHVYLLAAAASLGLLLTGPALASDMKPAGMMPGPGMTPPGQAAAPAEPRDSKVLRVYGPGGVAGPLQESGRLYQEKTGIAVQVVTGPMPKWIGAAKHNADLVFGGDESQFNLFNLNNPGLVDPASRVSLYLRPAAILVRKGNPKGIASLADLAKPGVKLLEVTALGQMALWEDLAGRLGLIEGIQKNFAAFVPDHIQAIELWRKDQGLDAMITFSTWHHHMKGDTDLVAIAEADNLYRGTPMALAAGTTNREQALLFLEFLRGPQGHEVFRRWGWK